MRAADLISNYAPMDMVRSLSRVRVVRIENRWAVVEVIKKDRKLIQAAGLNITPNQGIL